MDYDPRKKEKNFDEERKKEEYIHKYISKKMSSINSQFSVFEHILEKVRSISLFTDQEKKALTELISKEKAINTIPDEDWEALQEAKRVGGRRPFDSERVKKMGQEIYQKKYEKKKN